LTGALVAFSATAAVPAGASTKAWTGFGATLSAWKTAHPQGHGGPGSGCSGEGCYGGTYKVGGTLTYQFTAFTTTGAPANRVDGYQQAIGDGTSLAAAKAAVLQLMPSDTKTTAFWIVHNDASGNSCAFWNLKSKTLGGWLGGKKVGDGAGIVGVELNTLTSSDGLTYKPNDVSEAVVDIAPEVKGNSC
jgi:hypothetical protein